MDVVSSRRSTVIGLWTLFLLIGATNGAFAAPGGSEEVFDIPRVQGIAIDGNLSDWGDNGFCVNAVNWECLCRPLEDFDPRFRIAWDDRGLLVGATVRDNAFISPPNLDPVFGFLYLGDCVVVAASAGGEKPLGARVAVGLGTPPDISKVKTSIVLPEPTAKMPESQTVTALRKTDGGYALEMLLPWKALAFAPELSKEIGLQLFASDSDPSGKAFPAEDQWFTRWHPGVNPPAANSVYRLRLSDAASSSPPAAASSHTRMFTVPAVTVTGTADAAGKRVEVRQRGKALAEGVLEPRGGRSNAEIILPKRSGPDAYKAMEVFVDGVWIASFDGEKAPAETGRLAVGARVTTGTTAQQVHVRLSLGDQGMLYPKGSARVSFFPSQQTKPVLTADCPLDGRETTVTLPDGLYMADAVSNQSGWKLEGKAAFVVASDPRGEMMKIATRAEEMCAMPKYADCAGWLGYLATDIRQYLAEPPADDLMQNAMRQTFELDGWMRKVERNPRILRKLRGAQEWAYVSKADGTAQPFMVTIPKDYCPRKAYALEVSLHGASGSHLGDTEPSVPGFRLNVLGRSPYGGYFGLSEVDVLEAIDYVRGHWNIDPDRIHLVGASMGGLGTFVLASRFPDLFASARPICGGGLDSPVVNALHVPFFSVHSDDDWMVPIALSRAATRLIEESGGEAIQHETTGYGHNVMLWKEGLDSAAAWAKRQKRAASVRRVCYAATDQLARKAYWAEVVEWGSEGRPATIDARLEADNTLYLALDNVQCARFTLAASPADRASSLTVVANRTVVAQIPPPLPDQLCVTRSAKGWQCGPAATEPPAARLHYPGGATALYHGEPIMVVWGTRGDDDLTSRIRSAAESARRSFSAPWPRVMPHQRIGPIFNVTKNMYFGCLPGKPDTDVTLEDMGKYNLLLIGTPVQNSVVAKLADRLPVQLKDGKVVSNDGNSWSLQDRAIGLLYYNPDAPQRLIYWVGSDTPDFYKAGAFLMEKQSWTIAPPDFILTGATGPTDVASRRFDSRWNWEPGYKDSPTIPEAACSVTGAAAMAGETMRRAVGADFAMLASDWDSTVTVFAPGETRRMDLVANEYNMRLAVMELTGREILDSQQTLTKAEVTRKESLARGEEPRPVPRFFAAPEVGEVVPDRTYSVVTGIWDMWGYSEYAHKAPPSFRVTDRTAREALQRNLSAGARAAASGK